MPGFAALWAIEFGPMLSCFLSLCPCLGFGDRVWSWSHPIFRGLWGLGFVCACVSAHLPAHEPRTKQNEDNSCLFHGSRCTNSQILLRGVVRVSVSVCRKSVVYLLGTGRIDMPSASSEGHSLTVLGRADHEALTITHILFPDRLERKGKGQGKRRRSKIA